jgi:hypothetical protein
MHMGSKQLHGRPERGVHAWQAMLQLALAMLHSGRRAHRINWCIIAIVIVLAMRRLPLLAPGWLRRGVSHLHITTLGSSGVLTRVGCV